MSLLKTDAIPCPFFDISYRAGLIAEVVFFHEFNNFGRRDQIQRDFESSRDHVAESARILDEDDRDPLHHRFVSFFQRGPAALSQRWFWDGIILRSHIPGFGEKIADQ